MAVNIDGEWRDRQLNRLEARDTAADRHLGLDRVGYDTDNETYTYRDSNTGEYYTGGEGNRYGPVNPQYNTAPAPPAQRPRWSEYPPSAPSPSYDKYPTWRYFAPFVVIILVVLGLLFKYVNSGGDGPAMTWPEKPLDCPEGFKAYTISEGDTCWSIADESGKSVEELTEANALLNCDKLVPGKQLCVWT